MDQDEYQRAIQFEREKGEVYGQAVADAIAGAVAKALADAAPAPLNFVQGEIMSMPAFEPLRDYRKEVWIGTFTAVAGCFNAKDATVAESWADKALKLFDERFPK